MLNMEITEKERLMLVGKKEEIGRLTEDIIELTTDLKKNETELKKRVTIILSLISTIASYTKSKKLDMVPLVQVATHIFHMIETNPAFVRTITTELEFFCNIANSITFDFTGKDLRITLPKNINIGKITNQ